jgi:hypothetical protein
VDFDVPPEQKAALRSKFDRLFMGMVAPPINLPGALPLLLVSAFLAS